MILAGPKCCFWALWFCLSWGRVNCRSMLRTLGRLARRMRVLSQGFRSQIDEIAREVDPRADLQRITHSHPFEEDVGTPTLFDEPLEDGGCVR